MTRHDTANVPSTRDTALFGLIVLAFGLLLGWLALGRPHVLLVAGIVASAAWLLSLAFNDEESRRGQLVGALTPVLLLGGHLLARAAGGVAAAASLAGLGLIAALAVWSAPAFGRRLRAGWMRAVTPVGWSVSRLLLGIVYYVVLTPIGLALRLAGRDPLRRRAGSVADSYWADHRPARDVERYFRQH